ncbi:uncharacterized protein LOC144818371 [Lissotriton helveticus]
MSRLFVRALLCFLACSLALSLDEGEQDVLTVDSVEVGMLWQALLRLGSVLKEQAANTKEKMAGVHQELELFNRSLAELLRQVGACERARDSPRWREAERGHREDEFQGHAVDFQAYLSQMVELETSLEAKLNSLEKRLEKTLDLEEWEHLMALLTSQSVRIDDLFTDVETQDNEINAQEERLENLVKEFASRKKKLGKRRQQ